MADYSPEAVLADPASLPIHRAIAAIKIRVRDHGEHWAKCANCGDPYQITAEWGDGTVCGPSCFDSFAASLFDDSW